MQLVNDRYEIQGLDVLALTEQFGAPLYVYDAERIVHQYELLAEAYKSVPLRIQYACKALTALPVLRLLKGVGSGLDCVSIHEVRMGLSVGYDPKRIIYTPNGVPFSEIEEAVELGVWINIDNLPYLERFGQKYGGSVPIAVRINPHIQAGGNANIQVGHVGSKFGISILQIDHVHEIVEKYGMRVEGLHMHSGSDILNIESFLEGAEVIFHQALRFTDLSFIDLGSGYKVAYRDGDPRTDVRQLGAELGAAFNAFCELYGRQLELWIEPGKFLVSESGFFLAKVNVVKPTPACVFVGLDTGFNHLIRPMFYDSYHRIENVSNPSGPERVYNVVGYICETDTFAADRPIAEAHEGDILAFRNAGAYGFEMGSQFNSRPRPAQVMIHNGEAKLIRRRETHEDLIATQIDIEL